MTIPATATEPTLEFLCARCGHSSDWHRPDGGHDTPRPCRMIAHDCDCPDPVKDGE